MKSTLISFWKEEEGLTVVEYAIAGGLIGATVIAAFTDLGKTVGLIIANINTKLQGAPGA